MAMPALGQKQTFRSAIGMSALPPKADMCGAARDVRFGPIADFVAMQPTAFEKGYRHSSGLSRTHPASQFARSRLLVPPAYHGPV
jgi:hypothetical protein